MTFFGRITVLIFFSCIFCLVILNAQPKKELPLIIFDTDMGPDYDDVGAIAVLHALADNGECKILATVSCNRHPSIAPAIEVFNRFYKRSYLPVGVPAGMAPGFTNRNGWNDSIINRFAPELRNKKYENAVSVYRNVLAAQKDNSVIVVTVGFWSNISDLLQSAPDKYSQLSGVELIKKKVKNWVAMAGIFPQGKEFNVFTDSLAAVKAIEKWPSSVPVLFSGFEIGAHIYTGKQLASRFPAVPTGMGYSINLMSESGKNEKGRQSWDQTAVLCAVRNPETYFYVNGPGRIVVKPDGSNAWDPDTNANHYFLVHKYPFAHIENVLEELMEQQPKQ